MSCTSKALANPELLENYGRGTPDDWIERNLYSRFPSLGIVAVLRHAARPVRRARRSSWSPLQLAAQPFFAAGIINGLGHSLRLSQLRDAFGRHEHHAVGPVHRGRRAAQQPPCVPLVGALLRCSGGNSTSAGCASAVFSAVGLAQGEARRARAALRARRQTLDTDTVQALFTNRMHVLRDYARRVVRPVCRELARREPDAVECPSSAPKLLIRHPSLLAEKTRIARSRICWQRHEELRAFVEFRERLHAALERRQPGARRAAAPRVVRAGRGQRHPRAAAISRNSLPAYVALPPELTFSRQERRSRAN